MKEKFRGIKTTSIPKNEDKALTIINRLGQKSMSLPRITDSKRLAGFAGLAGTARKIAKLIPNVKYYVEPLAGSAKVAQELMKRKDVKIGNIVLNDNSDFVFDWLNREFNQNIITKDDFADCVREWDTKDTLFLFDQPWFKNIHDQQYLKFNRESTTAYDKEVLDLCKKMQGKFIITTRKENTTMLNSGYRHKHIKSEYVISGKYPRVLITTNLKYEKKLG